MRRYILPILNVAIVILGVIGIVIMLTRKAASGSGLTSDGFENLKYYTVLSNILCTLVAAWGSVFYIKEKENAPSQPLIIMKLISAAAVGLTFVIIAFFLQPLYKDLNLYDGSNLYFHLIIPVLAMIEFVLTPGRIPFRYTVISAVPTLIYGTCYLVNILVNGVGQWPDSNDWYGFVNWGLPIGIVIFAVIVLMSFGMSCLLRGFNKLAHRFIK
ncbi:MAG: hypothetical protein IJ757_08095 [Clostridiales bacterium]|nr:hypothetical protein [Clostridiales bacterium]